MEALLDREMPTGPRRDRRRWFLLILFLLLLIGVCNCPGRRWFFAGKREVSKVVPGAPGAGHDSGVVPGGLGGEAGVVRGNGGVVVSNGVVRKGVRKMGNEKKKMGERTDEGQKTMNEPMKEDKPEKRDDQPEKDDGKEIEDQKKNHDQKKGDDQKKNDDGKKKDDQKKNGGQKKQDEQKRKDEEKKNREDTTERHDGFMVGIGLNQFFTVGGQQASAWNSGGITGTLEDYIPVPLVRFYFDPELYVQVEAQINTPQYTRKNLVAVKTPVDSVGVTAGGQVQTVQTTVSINKLFYFNVPLSIHYTVFDHLDLGAGLQYSRLTNGIGVFNRNYNTGGTTADTTATKSFKGDSIYKEIRTHEFRFLVDANYMWKRFILGVRYNQALSKFIHVEISPGQITQARNSSLQLYIRYILWDGRRKRSSLPAK